MQQFMYASSTNFLLQSVDTTRDAKQGKPFAESLKCIEDKASSSQLNRQVSKDIRFIDLFYVSLQRISCPFRRAM